MKERIAFVDYIRVVACFLVMIVHASENFYVHHDNISLVAFITTTYHWWPMRATDFGCHSTMEH